MFIKTLHKISSQPPNRLNWGWVFGSFGRSCPWQWCCSLIQGLARWSWCLSAKAMGENPWRVKEKWVVSNVWHSQKKKYEQIGELEWVPKGRSTSRFLESGNPPEMTSIQDCPKCCDSWIAFSYRGQLEMPQPFSFTALTTSLLAKLLVSSILLYPLKHGCFQK